VPIIVFSGAFLFRLQYFYFMKQIFVVFFLVLLCCSCGNYPIENEPDGSQQVDATVRWAKGFDFYANNNEEGIVLYDLVNGSSELSRWARLKSGGQKKEGVHYLDSEVTIAAQSTTQMAMIEAIDGLEKLACAAYLDYIKSNAILDLVKTGEVKDISGVGEIDFEKLILCNPDLMLIYPFGYESEEKFKNAGIESVPISEYLEPHPLGRSEWIKMIGWLLQKDNEAEKIFGEIEAKYLDIAKAKNQGGPVVFTGSYSGGNWYAPGGDTFMAQFIEDAGGVYLFEDEQVNENITLPFELLYSKAIEADFWSKVVFEKGDLTLDQLAAQDQRFAKLPCFQNSNVFYCNAAETDYFGEGVMQPHLILEDLVHLLNEEDFDHHFFKPIEK